MQSPASKWPSEAIKIAIITLYYCVIINLLQERKLNATDGFKNTDQQAGKEEKQKQQKTAERQLQVIVHMQIDINPLNPRVISIKFLLVISVLYKTEWSRELRTGSHKMHLLDILTTSPRYF